MSVGCGGSTLCWYHDGSRVSVVRLSGRAIVACDQGLRSGVVYGRQFATAQRSIAGLPMTKTLFLSLCLTCASLPFSACNEPEFDLFTVNGLVTGHIRDAAGIPVQQATVYGSVGDTSHPRTDSTRTAPDGSYSIRFTELNQADVRAPLALRVVPPSGSPLLVRDSAGLVILIAKGWPPRETTRVDIVLHDH